MRDTFNFEYELPSNLPGLQWTGLDLRPVSELNYPGSSEEQTIAKVPQKQVRMSHPLYTPVPSYLRTTSRCSTPRIEDQDECIQRVSAAIRVKSPNRVYNNKAPCVGVVSQVNDNVHVSSESPKETDFDWLKKRFQDHCGNTESPAALR